MLVTVLELEVDGGDLGNSSGDEGSSEEVVLGPSGVEVEASGWLVNGPLAADIWGAYETITSKNT